MTDYDTFVAGFPEFANTDVYLSATVNFWLGQAALQIGPSVFGTSTDLATMLWTAHYVTMAARDAKAAAAGGIGGAITGPMTSKSVADVSASYAVTTTIEGAGPWNATSYGQRYYQLLRAFASGPRYRPGPCRIFR